MTEPKNLRIYGKISVTFVIFTLLKRSKLQPQSLVCTYVKERVVWKEEEVGLRDGGVFDQRSAGIFIYGHIY